jgi:hypothetical protein
MIEIGVAKMASIELWRNYFDKCVYYGVDINAAALENEVYPNFHILKGDQSDLDFINILTNKAKEVDFVIEDGSHVPIHQAFTFNHLFEKVLAPGGIYIIEDVETSFWKKKKLYGNEIDFGVGHPNSLVERVKHIIDCVNSKFTNGNLFTTNEPISHRCQKMIESITFSSNSIIFVKKDPLSFSYYYNQDYPKEKLI